MLRADAHQTLELEIDKAIACGCRPELAELIEVGLLRFHQNS